MISFSSIQIINLDSYDNLFEYIPESLVDDNVIDVLKNNLAMKS